ncbi:Bleomycin hydrolase, partial [mine drainage metagenome]
FHRDPGITPRTFYERYVGLDLDAYAGVMNLPTSDKPYGRTYRTAYLPTVHGGTERPYLNIDAETMSSLALRQVLAGEGVYFSCDVVQMMDREAGILDDALYDLEGVLGVPFHLSKPDRLGYGGAIEGSHVMLLAGVHVVDGAPVRWKVENSWGEEHGKKGYFVMSDGWFRNYALGIVVRKEYLSADLRAALEEPPTVLPPWDPMQYVASVR